MEPIKNVTSYSFRRLAPTLGHMLHLEPEEMVALGGWQEKSEVASSKAAMPLHERAARCTQSMRGKHRVLQIVGQLATYPGLGVGARRGSSSGRCQRQRQRSTEQQLETGM